MYRRRIGSKNDELGNCTRSRPSASASDWDAQHSDVRHQSGGAAASVSGPQRATDSIASIFACSTHPPLMSFLIAIDHWRRRTPVTPARALMPMLSMLLLLLLPLEARASLGRC